jgi:hypothetical protein
MEAAGLALFQDCLSRSQVYLEYGCGGSTLEAARASVPAIFSIDTDIGWIKRVRQMLEGPRTGGTIIHCDLGPVRNWGYPVNANWFERFHTYPMAPWDAAKAAGMAPDLILVDGRFRVACFLYSLVSAKAGATILFDDYTRRPQYHVVEEFLRPAGFAGRMARFEVTDANLDPRALMRRFAEHLVVLR